MNGRLNKQFVRALLLVALLLPAISRATLSADFHGIQGKLDDALLDIYSGTSQTNLADQISTATARLKPYFAGYDTTTEAEKILETPFPADLSDAGKIGMTRARLQQAAALAMLQCQKSQNFAGAQQWRALITLPQFAEGVDSAMLLQNPQLAAKPEVAVTLAREYLEWQTMRIRQLLDFLQQQVAIKAADKNVIEANEHEILALSDFPLALAQAAGLTNKISTPTKTVAWNDTADEKQKTDSVTVWRNDVESDLPNLLSQADIGRMQRLLARCVKLVPREYSHGVANGKLIIPLELREAKQFTDQSQTLVNQLAPVWKTEQPAVYAQYRPVVSEKLAAMQKQLDSLASQDELDNLSKDISSILEDKFKLSARRAGDSGDVIDETVLEVRAALGGSLAAAQAQQWQSAESQRMDAYTAFDTEIEARVLPRNPDLARKAERSFLEGDGYDLGIKALLDRHAPMDQLEAGYDRALSQMTQCTELLKVAVSPATIGFTAFTIVAREGLEAIIILAALMAGLRGVENASTRRGIAGGAWMGLVVTIITFWLSRTVIHSLTRFGEKLEAVVSIFAVFILFIVTNWVFHRVYWAGWNSKLRALSKSAQDVSSTRWEWLALLGVGFLTVYREGFEMALFLQSLLLEGSKSAVFFGGLVAVVFLVLLGLLTFTYGVKLPYRKLMIFTGLLVVSIMATFIGSTVRLFQTVDWMPIHPVYSLHFPNWTGLWLGLYPSWEGILIPPLALIYVGGMWGFNRWRSRRSQKEIPAGTPVAAKG
ncbi:MAG TPA: FTR1 family protein [Verrucomicrobiae bacterium]|nr:FTR1 family protein [Verrucomicrobiae bacterium]